jgi:predicted ATPase/class 3 adenylate cyclase
MTALPSGTVTFLFTDIQGSTALWENHQRAMQIALARHDELLRSAIVRQGGAVFKTVGDAFYAAFATADAAVRAALTAQRALQAEPWGAETGPLRVRMALHTGTADERDGDYFGPPLNRVARLLAVGHGGQILLSLTTQELIRDQLPTGADLRDRGEHSLKDLIRPERIFQLVVPDLPSDFPPLKTLNNRPNNLPMQATPLIGREREVAAACALLRQPNVRLLTFTGLGGTGKTRLSLQVAAELLDDFANGVFFVALDLIRDPDLVVRTIAHALGVTETGEKPVLETLKDYLRDKQVLLVLDNFEQVVEAAPVVSQLLLTSPGLKVLVTTRIVLHLYGEREFPVPPLALPNPHHLPPLEHLSQYDAVRLFIERAQAVKPDFTITNANAPAVAEICHRLDGLPLAIELAAARIKLLPPHAMIARLKSRLQMLTGGARNLPARQQTIRGAIDWSYDLLQPEEQRLFARLAVFVGGCTFTAAEMICNANYDLTTDMLDGLQSLTDKSLLQQEEGSDEEPQFVMRQMIHEYALERLAASGEMESLREQHANYYLSLAEMAEPNLTGPDQATWLAQLERSHENLRAAIGWALERGKVEIAVRMGGALWRYCYARGYFSEGRQWLEGALALSGTVEATFRAKALNGAGILAWNLGDYPAAQTRLTESLEIRKQQGNKRDIAASLNNLGLVSTDKGDPAAAQDFYEQSLALWREIGDTWGIATSLTNLGIMVRTQGNLDEARTIYEESLGLWQKLGDAWGISTTLYSLGYVAFAQGDNKAARDFYLESLILRKDLGHKEGIVECLEGLAGLCPDFIPPHLAARLLGAAEALRKIIDLKVLPSNSASYDPIVALVRSHLDPATFNAAYAEGRIMPIEQAIAGALACANEAAS